MSDEVETIAHTILTQLGGAGFALMVGLINPVYAKEDKENAEISAFIRWRAKGNRNLNIMRVTLVLAKDTYRVTFGRVRGNKVMWSTTHDDVYCDDLVPLFESTTGLYTIPPRLIINGRDAKTGDQQIL